MKNSYTMSLLDPMYNMFRLQKRKWFSSARLLPSLLICLMIFHPLFGGTQPVLAGVHATQQQKGTVTGIVEDGQGEPIIGANVRVAGSSVGAITDPNGAFKLNVTLGTKLTVTFIGYDTKSVTVKSEKMRIILSEDAVMLKDIEVVAYGSQKKVTITGAISSVKGDELLKTPVGSISNALSGQLTGVTTVQYSGEPGSDAASIFVRGKGTWGNSSPLVQVDGVERNFNDIDPNEIESISILKDASATAVFGVRGANGVILITTKRGQEGKAKISISTSTSMIAPTKTIELANAYQYATFYNKMQKNDNPNATAMFSDAVIQKFQDHTDPIRFPDTDWVDYCLKDATLQTQHNINISGGTETVRYFISAGAFTQGGLFKQFGLPYDLSYQYNRFNYRSNLDIDVTKSTTLSFNLGGNVNNTNKPYTGQGSEGMLKNMYWATPFSSPGLVDGKLVSTATDYSDLTLPFVGGSGMTYYGGGFMSTSNNTLNADLILDQKLNFFTKGLSFKVKGSYNSSFTNRKNGSAAIARYTPVLMADGTIQYRKSGENTQIKL